ncbi:3-oxo-tetronate kinase [Erwinia sp. MMLR14_017]|uniref:3-oxo-tetronate kinase n=1 Tax=Erwinia sp. MMLR14_017 TaxID=3093842 RepID=UPI00298FB142|nr:3-oxo-tetronate kinase [Erwinia sp. MMLR14_017]MDW8847698.1 3-oxo-tetronate kinase [Erwinia sp. MMLR14_017]
MLIGVIADDFTGASDIAVTLSKGLKGEGGLCTTQYLGLPSRPATAEVEAGVIALKSRSVPADQAVAQSLAACRWLLDQGCEQIIFKYCSTFDSTDEGNIGPVTDALAEMLQASSVVVCPAFPAMGRTVYQGHLFVHDRLLNESGMEHHPLTPMKDADLRRVLARQSRNRVAHIGWNSVVQGSQALREVLQQQAEEGRTLVIVDAVSEHDLVAIGRACQGAALVTGGSGIAMALPHNFIAAGRAKGKAASVPQITGPEAILVGSCSGATRQQIAEHQKHYPVMMVEVKDVLSGKTGAEELVAFIQANQGRLPLVYSSGDPESVKQTQQQYGREKVAEALDTLFGSTAQKLVAAGVRRLVVGGGETSGAVVSALDLGALTIGEEIDVGVPALVSQGESPIALALKSGNFGGKDFFARAVNTLSG